MADPAAMRQAMTRLGCSEGAARAIVDDQGINDLIELKSLKDKDITTLCKVIRKPGGTIDNPRAAEPNQPETIPAPGHAISVRAELNIQLAAHCVRHMLDHASRPVDVASITSANVRQVLKLKDAEADYTKPDVKPKIDEKNWPKSFEAVNDYLARVQGEDGLPLAYVVRRRREISPHAEDPTANYTDKPDYEMICRAPHLTTGDNPQATMTFAANNKKVAAELTDVFRDLSAHTYGKQLLKTGDGRRGYNAIYDHYLGPNSVNNQAAAAESVINGLSYNGEGRRWNFEKCVTHMKDQHQILDGLVEYGYNGVDDSTKVRHLIHGIKTDKLDSTVNAILTDPKCTHDWDASVSLIKTFIEQKAVLMRSNTRAIAEVKTKPVPVEDRYYSKEECGKLSDEQKIALRAKRNKRGHKPGSKDSKVVDETPLAKKQKTLERAVSALSKKIDAMHDALQDKTAPDAASTADSSVSNDNSNRNNAALTRQK